MPHFYKGIQGYFNYPDFFGFIAERLPSGFWAAEVGVWRGQSTCYMLERLRELGKTGKYLVIDTFKGTDNATESEHAQIAKQLGGTVLADFCNNIQKVGVLKDCNVIQWDSAESADFFKNRKFDFVFIDAEHTYEAVKSDLMAWRSKVKSGGILGGHDYFHAAFPGVKQAADEFAALYELELKTMGECYYFVIP